MDRFLQDLQATDTLDRVRSFVQGGTWRSFLAKYPESNWMQKRVFQVSHKIAAKAKGSVESAGLSAAQDDLWRSPCNCAFWHGIFGGLYLAHLRHAIYHRMPNHTGGHRPRWLGGDRDHHAGHQSLPDTSRRGHQGTGYPAGLFQSTQYHDSLPRELSR